MVISRSYHRSFLYGITILFFLKIMSFAQNGKEFIEWIKQYSPTGYYIINEYETKDNKPGFHKQFATNKDAPIPVVATHETGHMYNWLIGQKTGNFFGFYIGNNTGYKVSKKFTPFNSKEIKNEIPSDLVTILTETYIIKGVNGNETGSMVWGLYGILDEYSMYATGLKAGVEMESCFNQFFNQPKTWSSLMGDATYGVEGSTEFRYFILKYILYAQKAHKDIYDKIIADKEIREVYTILTKYHEKTIDEYLKLCEAHNMDIENNTGYKGYLKFKKELEKQEYQDLNKLLFIDITNIEKSKNIFAWNNISSLLNQRSISFELYTIQGKKIHSSMLNNQSTTSFTILLNSLNQQCGGQNYIIRLSNGKDILTQKLCSFSQFLNVSE